MAIYLASFNEGIDQAAQQARARQLETSTRATVASSAGARLYEGACAVCHEVGGLRLFGSRPSLSLNSNLHSGRPDNLIQVILHGIAKPSSSDLGYMPAFKDSMNDAQIAELITYLRRQFAPDKPAWTDLTSAIGRIRQSLLVR
jgi:nicotinate dehydrogenase subunit B